MQALQQLCGFFRDLLDPIIACRRAAVLYNMSVRPNDRPSIKQTCSDMKLRRTECYLNGAQMYLDQVKSIVIGVLNLGAAGSQLNADSPLLGALPELDSMAVVGLIGQLEEQFGITVYDDEISASTFETLGSLSAFVTQKMAR